MLKFTYYHSINTRHTGPMQIKMNTFVDTSSSGTTSTGWYYNCGNKSFATGAIRKCLENVPDVRDGQYLSKVGLKLCTGTFHEGNVN